MKVSIILTMAVAIGLAGYTNAARNCVSNKIHLINIIRNMLCFPFIMNKQYKYYLCILIFYIPMKYHPLFLVSSPVSFRFLASNNVHY